MQVLSVIADFNGKNPNFQQHLVDIEKNEPNGGRSFAEILAVAKGMVNHGHHTGGNSRIRVSNSRQVD